MEHCSDKFRDLCGCRIGDWMYKFNNSSAAVSENERNKLTAMVNASKHLGEKIKKELLFLIR